MTTSVKFSCPRAYASKIIPSLSKIQTESGATVSISEASNEMQEVGIEGQAEAVTRAKKMIDICFRKSVSTEDIIAKVAIESQSVACAGQQLGLVLDPTSIRFILGHC